MYTSKFQVGQRVVRKSPTGIYSTIMIVESMQANLILCVWVDKYNIRHEREYLESELILAKDDSQLSEDDDGGNYDTFLWSDQL